jgi:hypothetical protein
MENLPISFAWPICFKKDGDYSSFANTVCKGREFRQPLSLPDSGTFIDGLELWLKADSGAASLFACFDGTILFQPATSSQPVASLGLYPAKKVGNQLRKLNLLEPLSTAFIYFNVDKEEVRKALIDLIKTSYENAGTDQKKWHPILDPKLFNREVGQKFRLDKEPDADKKRLLIEGMVKNFLEESVFGPPVSFSVLAGDRIGTPSTAFGGATPPVGCPLISPKHFVFKVEERCDRVRNPLYDLWTWLDRSKGANPLIKLLAPAIDVTGKPHPILQVTALDPAVPQKPSPRWSSDRILPAPAPVGKEYSLPIQNLAYFFYRDNARIEWRLNTESLLEAKIRSGQPLPVPTLEPTPTINALVENMWTSYAPDIVDMSLRFQVPCELIMAFLGKETSNLDKRVVRFEPVNSVTRKKLDKAILGNPTYEKLVEQYVKVSLDTITSPNVPDPWDQAQVIRSANGTQLTWGEMAELLNMSPYFQTRLSPGLMQTLISTAITTLSWAEKAFNDISKTYPQAGATTPWDYFKVDPKPTSASGYLNGWLLNPRNAIFVGTAYIRQLYNSDKRGTCWDPARQAAAYNAGSVRDPCGLKNKPDVEKDKLRTWGMCYFGDYMTRFGQAYNAAVTLLNEPTQTPVPPVRLRK